MRHAHIPHSSLHNTHPNVCRCYNGEEIKEKHSASYSIAEEDLRTERAGQEPRKETLRGQKKNSGEAMLEVFLLEVAANKGC